MLKTLDAIILLIEISLHSTMDFMIVAREKMERETEAQKNLV